MTTIAFLSESGGAPAVRSASELAGQDDVAAAEPLRARPYALVGVPTDQRMLDRRAGAALAARLLRYE